MCFRNFSNAIMMSTQIAYTRGYQYGIICVLIVSVYELETLTIVSPTKCISITGAHAVGICTLIKREHYIIVKLYVHVSTLKYE